MTATLRTAALVALFCTLTACGNATPAGSPKPDTAAKPDAGSSTDVAIVTDAPKLHEPTVTACRWVITAGRKQCADSQNRLQSCFENEITELPARPLRMLANCDGTLMVAAKAHMRQIDGQWILEGATVFKGPPQS